MLECGSVAEPRLDGWLAEVNAEAEGAPWGWASLVLEDKAGAGDVVWSRIVPDGSEPPPERSLPAGMRVLDSVPVVPLASSRVPLEGARLLRTLLVRVRREVDVADVEKMESSLVAMPRHIVTIRSWSLSRLDREATAAGWTHLWEQEFAEPRGFRPYMGHPYHWTGVERWFDPEIPGRIVDAEAHYLSPVPGAVVSEQPMDTALVSATPRPHNQTPLE